MVSHMSEVVADKLEQFIRDRFKVPPEDQFFTRTVRLWDEGYIDSIGFGEVITFLEKSFGVTILNEVLIDPEFTNIAGIARLVAQLRRGAQAA